MNRCDRFCKHSVWISKRTLGRTPNPRNLAGSTESAELESVQNGNICTGVLFGYKRGEEESLRKRKSHEKRGRKKCS